MSWNQVRHLSPLSEHPSASQSRSPAVSDATLSFLKVSTRLGRCKDDHPNAWVLLSAFLNHLDRAGKINLAIDIQNCDDNEQLVFLASHILDALLKPFVLAGGHAPPPLTTPPSQAAAGLIDLNMPTIESPSRAEQTNLRADCLRRDGFKCVYTGMWDRACCKKGTVHPPPHEMQPTLECARIIPFALGSFDDNGAVQTRNKAIIWFAIHRYFPEVASKIDARSVNQRGNAFCLETSLHALFGSYRVGFRPQVDHLHHYEITKLTSARVAMFPSKSGSPVVEFTSADNSIPLPDSDFLKVHLTIGQILQVSGLGTAISRTLHDIDLAHGCRGLHPDGSTDVGALLSRIMLATVRVDTPDG